DVESGRQRRLTGDGVAGERINGKPDWVYWEEIFGRKSNGFWWSPSSTGIAFLQFDESGVTRHPLLADAGEPLPEVYSQPYPTAGGRNPGVRVGVADVAGGGVTWLEVEGGDDSYVARVRWTPAGEVAVLHLAREQDRLDLMICDPATGACRRRLREERATWVDVADDFEILADGRLVWGSDRGGWRRLYLYGADGGDATALTPEGLAVTQLEAVDSERGLVYFSGHEQDPLGAKDRQLYRVPLAGGDTETLSGGEGWTEAQVAADGSGWVISHSTSARAPRVTCVRSGRHPVPLPGAAPSAYRLSDLPQWRYLTLPGEREGLALPARILVPPDLDPVRRYPAIMYHYGGPASQTIVDATSSRPARDLWLRRQAQRGYVVLNVDNEASSYFGKTGAERLHRRFGELELAGQLAGVAYLRSLGYVDAGRIGLFGWSGGGANTLYSLLRSPATWRAGVAGAPVTDWRLYDSIWTERYLDHPEDNADGYRDSSPLTWADRLEDALLLVHGTADDNVHPHNTVMLSRELVAAGKTFEQAFYPDEKHGFGTRASRHFYERMEAFFDRELGAGSDAPEDE
ncbi:MAG: DPP IV N-terminal domain-containing protein, partial [Thermoanaerobaculia bacterium]|nr:DPP IV N-terminal domain-containing protein [Thermoanaerobaculia bacterium]